MTGHCITFRELWELLNSTYAANERDIHVAYGSPTVIQHVEKLYSSDDAHISSVLVTNIGPPSFELVENAFKRRQFVMVLTLRRADRAQDSDPDWLSECRLPIHCNASDAGNTPRGIAPVPKRTATGEQQREASSEDALLVYRHLRRLQATQSSDDEKDDVSDCDDEEDDDDCDDEEDDVSDCDANDLLDALAQDEAALISDWERVTERKCKFVGGVRGLQRQHWARSSYANFFHAALFATRRLIRIERFDYLREDRLS